MKILIFILVLIPALALADDCRVVETESGTTVECIGSQEVKKEPEPRNWLKEIKEAEKKDEAEREALRKELRDLQEKRRELIRQEAR